MGILYHRSVEAEVGRCLNDTKTPLTLYPTTKRANACVVVRLGGPKPVEETRAFAKEGTVADRPLLNN